jgi:hypothetical protein
VNSLTIPFSDSRPPPLVVDVFATTGQGCTGAASRARSRLAARTHHTTRSRQPQPREQGDEDSAAQVPSASSFLLGRHLTAFDTLRTLLNYLLSISSSQPLVTVRESPLLAETGAAFHRHHSPLPSCTASYEVASLPPPSTTPDRVPHPRNPKLSHLSYRSLPGPLLRYIIDRAPPGNCLQLFSPGHNVQGRQKR